MTYSLVPLSSCFFIAVAKVYIKIKYANNL